MKSQLDMIDINNSRAGNQRKTSSQSKARNQGRARTMSREERQKLEKRKRIKAKRRRRRQLIRLCFHTVLLIAVIFFSVSIVKNLFGSSIRDKTNNIVNSLNKGQNEEKETEAVYVSKYGASIPQKLMKEEVDYKLKNLADQYPEFQDIYNNAEAYPQDLLAALCNNPDMIDFVKGYLTADKTVTEGLRKDELTQDFPLFIQWDTRWGYTYYGDDNMALSGCAPTCLSMVIVSLTKNAEATPDEVARFAEENEYYMAGTGTMWSLMTEGCEEFGVYSQELILEKNIILSELEGGNPIICSMSPGDFTASGHFIVLTGVKDGKIKVNDPNSKVRSSKLWDYETLEGQIKNLWVFRKKGVF